MKKLLTILSASLAVAAFADTDATATFGGETYDLSYIEDTNASYGYLGDGFERITVGTDIYGATDYWQGESDCGFVTNYDSAATYNPTSLVPTSDTKFRSSGENNKYLYLDSGTTVITHSSSVSGSGQDLSDGTMVYIDTMVQFTATDTAPDVTSGDKLLVWLQTTEDSDSGTVTTNLAITAGLYVNGVLNENVYEIPTSVVEVEEGEWYRLTIIAKRLADQVYSSSYISSFEVYLNDTQCTATVDDETVSVFPGLMKYDATDTATITSVGFCGKGAVDDLVFATCSYASGSFTYTLSVTGIESFEYTVDDGETESATVTDGTVVITTEGETLLIDADSIVYATGYTANPDWDDDLEYTMSRSGSDDLEAATAYFTMTYTAEEETTTKYWATLTQVAEYLADLSYELDYGETLAATLTLRDDYTAADEGDFVDVAENVTLTLDLAGKSLNSEYDAAMAIVAGDATLTITDSVGGGSIARSADDATSELIQNQGTLVVSVSSTTVISGGAISCESETALTINNGKFSDLPTNSDGDSLIDETTGAVVDDTGVTVTLPSGKVLTKGDDDEYYTLTDASSGDDDDETYEISDSDTLSSDGTLTVTDGTTTIMLGNYDVSDAFTIDGTTATVIAPVVEDSEDDADDALVIGDDDVTINVNAVEGMYYGVGTSESVEVSRPDKLTQYTGSNKEAIFKVEKPSEGKGFFRVYIDIAE